MHLYSTAYFTLRLCHQMIAGRRGLRAIRFIASQNRTLHLIDVNMVIMYFDGIYMVDDSSHLLYCAQGRKCKSS